MFIHQAYGLNILSDFLLPELPEGETSAELSIQKDKIAPPTLEATSINRQGREAYFGGTRTQAYLQWQGVTTLLAQNGETLIVDANPDIEPQFLNLYILSEALGLILYQRGFFLLHASAVKIGAQVIIFAGTPGAGKSTTAAAFAKAGYTVLADDMVAIDLSLPGQPRVYPAFPQIKIWESAAQGLGYDLSSLPRLFPGSRKRVIRQPENFPTQPFPLTHIFFLEESEHFEIRPLTGTDAFFNLSRFFPLPSQLLQGEALEQHFQQCLQLIDCVNLWKIENPKDFKTLSNLIHWVEHKMELTLVQ